MCKHVAAVLYGVGARLDEKPELFFTLRGVDMEELITAASASATAPIATTAAAGTALAGADLADIFGVDIEAAPTAIAARRSIKASPPAKKKNLPAKKQRPSAKAKTKTGARSRSKG